MQISNIKTGKIATLNDGTEALVVNISKGWIELDNGHKVRAKQIGTISDRRIEMVDEDEEDEGKESMSQHIAKYRANYETATNANGKKTKICGDDLSHLLGSLHPDQVVKTAAKVLGRPEVLTKYEGLNDGQRRMNAGNLLRNALKRGDIEYEDVEKGIQYV